MRFPGNTDAASISHNQTASPGKWYGWIHVILAAAAMIGTLPGRTHGLGLIT
jgi:hypothetical protein